MRNATVAALIYEFLFDVYWKMDHDRRRGWIRSFPDENGTLLEAFDHDFMGCREWTSGALERVGVLKALQPASGYRGVFYPLMTLDECAVADFSKYETFDNYCVAMFSFEYHWGQFEDAVEIFNLRIRSPRFLEAVACQDDIFLIEDSGRVSFNKSRFDEKVMTRWRGGLDVRIIRPKGGT
jgi:hypothetical protein